MHGDGIGSEQAQRAPHHRSVGHGVAWRWNGASSVPWEWRRGSRARTLAASSSRRVNAVRVRYRCGRASGGGGRAVVAPRGRRRVGWRGDRGRARGGGDNRRRAGWRWRPRCGGPSGVGVGERKRRRTQGRRWQWYIYATPLYSRCHPPTGSKGPLLPVRVTNRE